MDLEQAQQICKQYKIRAYISTHVDTNGDIYSQRINFWGANREQMIQIQRQLGIRTLEKHFRMGDVDFGFDNVMFNEVRKCKVVGYEEVHRPAETVRKPIYECK